jgi:hypothetical protein
MLYRITSVLPVLSVALALRCLWLEAPHFGPWTWTLERGVDPGVGVVQERIDPRLHVVGNPRPER